ncbi:MAG TPA: ribosome assembly RNA-binding protein YhbY [Spirochaetota bacterium]|nr:ribosome assembly RNA-binding protein YhbY [Spirochaetota bacterium]
MNLKYSQRKKLKALAHDLRPVIQVGKKGLTDELTSAVDKALLDHELIKMKFVGFKEEKRDIIGAVAKSTGCIIVEIIGHVAILYRPHPDEEKRRIVV